MNKIRRIHLLIVTVILFVGMMVAFIMVIVTPRQKTISSLEKSIAAEQQVANQRPQAQAALAAAKAQQSAADGKWQMVMRTKMSHISSADPYQAIFAMYKETFTYEPQLIAAFPDKRVKLDSRMNFPQYGFTPPPQNLVGRDYAQSLKLWAKSFPDLLSWLNDTESLPRVLELGGSISITKASTGINVSVPGIVHIYFKERPAAQQPTNAGTGNGIGAGTRIPPSVPAVGINGPIGSRPQGRQTAPSGDGFRPRPAKK